uniref:Uncharacterized protein n=1 Tax=Anguilla anguilla TaxID=7936 RepID=A0A0E9WQ64_ANGAN
MHTFCRQTFTHNVQTTNTYFNSLRPPLNIQQIRTLKVCII